MKLKVLGALAALGIAMSFAAPALAKSPYDRIIAKYASAYGVPVNLAHAVIHIGATPPPHRGRAGEIGLIQVKLQTARGMGYWGTAEGLSHPASNIATAWPIRAARESSAASRSAARS